MTLVKNFKSEVADVVHTDSKMNCLRRFFLMCPGTIHRTEKRKRNILNTQ